MNKNKNHSPKLHILGEITINETILGFVSKIDGEN
jgi:hypothetical protein